MPGLVQVHGAVRGSVVAKKDMPRAQQHRTASVKGARDTSKRAGTPFEFTMRDPCVGIFILVFGLRSFAVWALRSQSPLEAWGRVTRRRKSANDSRIQRNEM